MSYDRVAYSDKRPFTGDEYSDDPYSTKEKHHENGNGVYNDYTVEVEPKVVQPLKFFCCTCKNTKKAKYTMIAALLVLLICIILVVISAIVHVRQQKQVQPEPQRQFGLFAYGPDENNKIDYSVTHVQSYLKVLHRLEHNLNVYSPIPQLSNPDKYISCEVFDGQPTKVVPESNKVCMQTTADFGPMCQNENLYGLPTRPCVLLVLKLEEGFIPEPFQFNETTNVELQKILKDRISNASVGISCDGKTEADRSAMEMKSQNTTSGESVSMNSVNGPRIDYNPERGFPAYYFIQKERDINYISPAVMVQFNTIPANKEVAIKCTAWASNFNDSQPGDSTEYSVEFTFHLHG